MDKETIKQKVNELLQFIIDHTDQEITKEDIKENDELNEKIQQYIQKLKELDKSE